MKTENNNPDFLYSVKKFATAVFILFFSYALKINAQAVVDTVNWPPGYSSSSLRYKNVLKIDLSNHVWIGFRSVGAFEWDGGSWTVYDRANNYLPSDSVLSFAFTPSFTWIGTGNGLVRINGAVHALYDSLNSGLTDNYVRSLMADGNNLWIGTNHGLFLLNGTTWTHYSSANSNIVGDSIQDIVKAGANTLWIATTQGLSKFSSGTFTNFTTANSDLIENNIVKLISDYQGTIWLQSISIHIYFSTGTTIYRASEYFSSCSGVPIYAGLIGKSTNGKAVVNASNAYNEVVLVEADQINETVYRQLFSNLFLQDSGPLSRLLAFDIDSVGKIWICSKTIQPVGWKLYSFDYSAIDPYLLEDNCYLLDANQVRARLWNDNDMFNDHIGSGKYEVPAGSGKIAISSSGLWIGGLDSTGQLKLAAQAYAHNTSHYPGASDFWPGPLDTITATIDSITKTQYNKIWKIDRNTINQFTTQFTLGNVTNGSYTIPDIILNWPAQGSGNYSRNLAPFVDYNHDGIYNALDGDYPDMKGDQMLWWIMNDNYSYHGISGGQPLKVEIQAYAYAFDCSNVADSDSVINYTTFYHYNIINRSNINYNDVYIGIFTDPDLGNYNDDYIGCDTTNDFAFCYNDDLDDEGLLGYGVNPPMINCLLLKGPVVGRNDSIDNNHNGVVDEAGEYDMMSHFQYWDNDGSVYGNPNTMYDYYRYMQSIWRNGLPVTFGGDGHGGGSGTTSDPSDFMFPSNPYDASTSAWNETNSGVFPGDRRFVQSSGPFSLREHEKKSVDFAYVFTRNTTGPNGLNTSWSTNMHDIMKVKHWFDTDSFPCKNSSIGINEIKNNPIALNLFPNPAKENLTVLVGSKHNGSFNLEITDLTGRKIRNGIIFSNKNNTISVDEFSSGIYFIKVSNAETFAVRKFVKQ